LGGNANDTHGNGESACKQPVAPENFVRGAGRKISKLYCQNVRVSGKKNRNILNFKRVGKKGKDEEGESYRRIGGKKPHRGELPPAPTGKTACNPR